MTKQTYLRFVVNYKDPSSNKRQGIFQALRRLRDRNLLTETQSESHKTLIDWFQINLLVPDRFSRSGNSSNAICWFKSSAVRHITKMREMCQILKEHDIVVDMIKTDNPGYIVYEDEDQICAEPFKETKT